MTKQRPIQTGHVYRRGPSWFVQYREDTRDAAGAVIRRKRKEKLAPVTLPDGRAITKREAERIAYERILAPLNQLATHAGSLYTIEEYWQRIFRPAHDAGLKAAGRRHYDYLAGRILENFGAVALRDLKAEHIQTFLADLAGAGIGAQTARHYRNAISALYRFAIARGDHPGPNPAAAARAPRIGLRGHREALTLWEAHTLCHALPEPVATAARLSVLTSLTAGEVFGLDRYHVNIEPEPIIRAWGILPPFTLIVAQTVYAGALDTPKAERRRRLVPLTPALADQLALVLATAPRQEPEAPLFQGAHGARVDYHNLQNRTLRPLTSKLFGRAIGWHALRRTAATLTELAGMPLSERQALLGHAAPQMTLYYSVADLDRRRPYLTAIETALTASARKENPNHAEIEPAKTAGDHSPPEGRPHRDDAAPRPRQIVDYPRNGHGAQ